MIKWLFFDIDNTLFDTKKLSEMARKNAIKAMIDMGLKASEDEAYEDLIEMIERMGSNSNRHFNELVEYYNNIDESKIVAAGIVAYHNTKFEHLKPYRGVYETLATLGKNYKLGIISNGDRIKQWEKLLRLGLAKIFEIVLISGELKLEKPSPLIFQEALKKAECKPEEAIMIGDKEDDMAANVVGMHIINSKKDIEKFGDLIGLIKEKDS